MSADRRQKLSKAQMNEIRAMLSEGGQVDAIALLFKISTTHVYRIQAALRNGAINLKPTSLSSCLEHIKNGLPFRRVSWPDKLYFYCAIDEPQKWFVQVNTETGCQMITYSLGLELEDLLAKDWIVMTWEAVE